jgi:hypothetical protein
MNRKRPLKIKNNVIDDILTKQKDKKHIINKVGVISETVLNRDVIFATNYEGISYLFSNAEIIPHSTWAQKINNIINQNGIGIKMVIPHYYEKNKEFYTRLIIVMDNDFYIILEENNVSEVMDFKKDFSISFSENIAEVYTCNETELLLHQMLDSGVITKTRKDQLLKDLMC